MNGLSRRLSRMEETMPASHRIEIEAADESEADGKLLDAILECGPGPVSFAVTIDGIRSEWRETLSSHDDWVLANS